MHPFHLVVRSCFDEVERRAMLFEFAPECGGAWKIALYPTDMPRRGQAYCCVDGLGFRGDAARLILEIEEAKIPKPGDLFGKFYPAAHSTHYIANRNQAPVPVRNAAFVQIVCVDKLERSGALNCGSTKLHQWGRIERDIQETLADLSGRFLSYRLFAGTMADFSPGGAERLNLVQYLGTLAG